MKFGVDFLTDNSDDIFIDGDIRMETDFGVNAVKNAERRVLARYDDFILANIGSGLERYLGQKINESTRYYLATEIKRSLTSDGLFNGSEFSVIVPDVIETRKVPILLKFSSPFVQQEQGFKIIVNIENQRSYK